jgi:hypothetical protein
MSMTELEQPQLTEKEKQKLYNQKWLAKLTPEQRKEYFKQKARQTRGWKCADCGSEPLLKTLDTKEKLCLKCFIKRLKQT